jgi:hypothetical protein
MLPLPTGRARPFYNDIFYVFLFALNITIFISAMLVKKIVHNKFIAFVLFAMNCIGCGRSNSQERSPAFPTWWLNRRTGSAQERAKLS